MTRSESSDGMEPIARPLNTLTEVQDWEKPPEIAAKARVPLSVPNDDQNYDAPRLLVCHDMKGGYIGDRFIQGSIDSEAYRIVHWYLIDTFVYFSHHLVTIPPPGWIDAAHRNGTKILGTFITEWDSGAECCAQFLSTPDAARKMADKLVDIMDFHQFDGWLINIENEIKNVDNLLVFLRHLTLRCHARLHHSRVIWYDSVTTEGKLDWQNELNEKNAVFFDACDGIFLNYTWKDSHLKRSRHFSSNKAASERQNDGEGEESQDSRFYFLSGRRYDVYVGIDVFGRGCMGGGGFNCCEPLKLIKEYDLSVAVFAPGWTHEKETSKHCQEIESKFWGQFDTFPSIRKKIMYLPVTTSFCCGCGQKLFHHGEILSETPWYNLSVQQLQPNLVLSNQIKYCHNDGYHGGGCLQVIGTGTFRLFTTDIKLNSDLELYVTYVFKPLNGSDPATMSMRLKTSPKTNEPLQWEDKKRANEWIQRSGVFKPNEVETNLVEVSVHVEKLVMSEGLATNECSYLIGFVEISQQKKAPLRLSGVTVKKLPAEIESDEQSFRPFKVQWTSPDITEHCAVLMQYMCKNELLTQSNSAEAYPYLLGHTRSNEFLVMKLPEIDADWDAIEITVVPYNGLKLSTGVSRSSLGR